MSPPVTRKRSPPAIDDCPHSLREGRKRLVGLIDGYPSYYDRRRHRIDVLLEDGSGDPYLSEYYRLPPRETVRGYLQQVEREGYDCQVLDRWSPEQGTHRGRSTVLTRLHRRGRALYGCLLRWTRRTGRNV